MLPYKKAVGGRALCVPALLLAMLAMLATLMTCTACAGGAWAQGDDGDRSAVAPVPTVVQDFALAARTGDLTKVKQLLARGVNINARSSGRHTALMGAASYGEVEMVKFLLSRGADPNLRDADGHTALDRARARGNTAVAVVLETRTGVRASGKTAQTAPAQGTTRMPRPGTAQTGVRTAQGARTGVRAPGLATVSPATLVEVWKYDTITIRKAGQPSQTKPSGATLNLRQDGTYDLVYGYAGETNGRGTWEFKGGVLSLRDQNYKTVLTYKAGFTPDGKTLILSGGGTTIHAIRYADYRKQWSK